MARSKRRADFAPGTGSRGPAPPGGIPGMTLPLSCSRRLIGGPTLRYNRPHVDNDPVPDTAEKIRTRAEYPPAGREYPVSSTPHRSPAMSIDDIKKRFTNEIKLRAYDDKYIDKGEEREILQIAIQLGVNIDSARGALASVCEDSNY